MPFTKKCYFSDSLLGVVRIVTGSIAWGVVFHFFINFASYILPHQDKTRPSLILIDDGPGLFHALLGLVLALVFLASTVVYIVTFLTALISPIVVLICHPAMKPKSVGGTGPG